MPQQFVATFQSQRGRDAAPGVPGHEQVVRAFLRVRITHQAAFGANRVELPIPPGNKFVRINLMAGVPNQPILAEIEHGVQRQAKLDDAQIRSEVRRATGNQVAQGIAHFLRQLLQLIF